jgi:hypothetical protein
VGKTQSPHFQAVEEIFQGDYDVILGMPWIENNEPIINWKMKTWIFPMTAESYDTVVTEKQFNRAIKETKIALAISPHLSLSEANPLWDLSETYEEFVRVFNNLAAGIPPQNSSKDHTIKLIGEEKPL